MTRGSASLAPVDVIGLRANRPCRVAVLGSDCGRRKLMDVSLALPRFAKTGIYLVRGVPRDLQRAARGRAAAEGTTLRAVLVQALRDYASGAWTPRPPKG
jgi:hypothetical protein